MVIKWLGQSCVQIKSQDRIIVIDPLGKGLGLKVPQLRADIVLITHPHSDHNNINAIKPREGRENFVIFEGAGEFESQGVLINGIPAWHDKKKEEKVNMYLLSLEGINLAHLSDIGQKKLNKDQLEALNRVDVLFLPVGGVFTIGAEEAFEIANQIDPRIIIPIHYKIEGLNLNLEKVDKFLELEGTSPEPIDELEIVEEKIPKEDERKVILLRP